MDESSRLFQKNFKKKRETKSGQTASKIKKWKFEDEMFLLSLQERDTCTNLKDVSDDDNKDEPNEDEYENDDREDDQNDDKNNDKDDDVDVELYVDEELHVENEKDEKQIRINRKMNSNVAKSKKKISNAIIRNDISNGGKYLLNKKIAKAQTPAQSPNAIDTFFSSIAATVKNFSPYYQNIAKSQIFSIVNDLEMKQILQAPNSHTATQPHQYSTQMQSYHTGPYSISHPLTPPSLSPSPSISTPSSSSGIANSSSSYFNFPATVSMPRETTYNKEM